MAYVDPNDNILKWENGDVVTPQAAKMNMHLDSVGTVTNALRRRGTYTVNNIPERTALVNTIGASNISNSNPLMVWRANADAGKRLEYTENGGTWHYVKTSQDSIVRAVNARVTANVSVPNATYTRISNWTIVRNDGFSVPSSGLFTIPEDGWYSVTAQFGWASADPNSRYLRMRFSGTAQYRTQIQPYGSPAVTSRYLLSGSTVEFYAYQASGAAVAVEGNAERSVVSIVKVG